MGSLSQESTPRAELWEMRPELAGTLLIFFKFISNMEKCPSLTAFSGRTSGLSGLPGDRNVGSAILERDKGKLMVSLSNCFPFSVWHGECNNNHPIKNINHTL